MKNTYETPVINIIEVNSSDVICSSNLSVKKTETGSFVDISWSSLS